MSICVIGGSGFIGTRLCQRLVLDGGGNFSIIDKSSSEYFPNEVQIADVRSLEELRAAIPYDAVIINLAAEHRDDVRPQSLYDDVNTGGARNICTVAREKNVKTIVFTSSVAVYGFAPIGTDEFGAIAPFNDYGRTKYDAEQVFKIWQAEAPEVRTLVIVRPTVVFGEQNRGNVYNLLRQISSGNFVMVGNGKNRKSLAYVENLAAFLQYAITAFKPSVHIYNYIDKPDISMNKLVGTVNRMLGRPEQIRLRLPYAMSYAIVKCFDLLAAITGKQFPISSIRIKKFCSNSVYETSIGKTDFVPHVSLAEALERTVKHEFIEKHARAGVFYTE